MKKIILASTIVLIIFAFTNCSNPSEQKSSHDEKTVKSSIVECVYINTEKKYLLSVRDLISGDKSSRIVTIYGPYELSYEKQTKKTFYVSNNSDVVDSVEVRNYLWTIPENITPTSEPYMTCTSIDIIKKSKDLQDEYDDLMTTKGIIDGYVKERMIGKHTYKDYEQAESARPYDNNSNTTYVEEDINGWMVNIRDYLWIARYEIDGSSNLAAAYILEIQHNYIFLLINSLIEGNAYRLLLSKCFRKDFNSDNYDSSSFTTPLFSAKL